LLDGLSAHTTNGTPADCVALAVSLLGEGGFDLVVSGINHGWNLGPDVFHSGTVMAAAEASLLGLPALAFSAGGGEPTRFETAAWFARAIVQVVMQKGLPKGTFLNVNIPDLPRHKIESVMITRLNLSVFNEPFERRSDPHGASYYWRGGPVRLRISSDSCRSQNDQAGTDTLAVHQGFVSVTPLRLDPTDTDSLEILQSWRLETSADPNEEGDNRE
jgi:5'-nucleotidase